MLRYDPEIAPPAAEWNALDEQERIMLVEKFHRRAGVSLPNETAHAIIHVIVENQLAIEYSATVHAVERLRGEGLARHETVHAVGSVLARHLQRLLQESPSGGDANLAYALELEGLTAESWRATG